MLTSLLSNTYYLQCNTVANQIQNSLRLLRNRMAFRWVLVIAVFGILCVSLPPLALLSYDVSYFSRPASTITNIVLVYFNQDTISQLDGEHGQLNRTNHARLLNRLAEDGAKLVFYDVVFTETNNFPEEDRILARAIKDSGSVVLVAGGSQSQGHDAQIDSLWPPIPEFREVATAWGHGLLFDNVVRKMSGDVNGKPYLAWVGASLLQPERFKNQNHQLKRWLNYYSTPDRDAFAHYYFHDVVNGTVPPGAFSGKIVFVGQKLPFGNLASQNDTFLTPYSRFGFRPMPGVEIHATAFLNLMQNDYLLLAPLAWQWVGAILWGIICIATFRSLIGRPKVILIFTAALLAITIVAVSLYIQWHFHWWWAWIGPALQPAVASSLVWGRQKALRHAAFISYRKSEDIHFARLIREKLKNLGKDVCIDQTALNVGQRFDEQLLNLIESSQCFILILSPKSLARCVNEDDWIRKELHHSLLHKKKIIPIFKDGFEFTDVDNLPPVPIPEIIELQKIHGLKYVADDFDGLIDRLVKIL